MHEAIVCAWDPHVPTLYDKPIALGLWQAAITTELGKFRDHNCLVMTPFSGQHLVPMKWIFSIKTDGTYKARLEGRDDLMIRSIDFNPKEICCGIILALAVVASYKHVGRSSRRRILSNKSQQRLPSPHQDSQRHGGRSRILHLSCRQPLQILTGWSVLSLRDKFSMTL